MILNIKGIKVFSCYITIIKISIYNLFTSFNPYPWREGLKHSKVYTKVTKDFFNSPQGDKVRPCKCIKKVDYRFR
jgi:hypothetical protein